MFNFVLPNDMKYHIGYIPTMLEIYFWDNGTIHYEYSYILTCTSKSYNFFSCTISNVFGLFLFYCSREPTNSAMKKKSIVFIWLQPTVPNNNRAINQFTWLMEFVTKSELFIWYSSLNDFFRTYKITNIIYVCTEILYNNILFMVYQLCIKHKINSTTNL